jgi:hypothetical protein
MSMGLRTDMEGCQSEIALDLEWGT